MNQMREYFALLLVVSAVYSGVIPLPDIKCPVPKNGEITVLANPDNYSTFYVCIDQVPVLHECLEGLWFNPVLKVCEFRYMKSANIVNENIHKTLNIEMTETFDLDDISLSVEDGDESTETDLTESTNETTETTESATDDTESTYETTETTESSNEITDSAESTELTESADESDETTEITEASNETTENSESTSATDETTEFTESTNGSDETTELTESTNGSDETTEFTEPTNGSDETTEITESTYETTELIFEDATTKKPKKIIKKIKFDMDALDDNEANFLRQLWNLLKHLHLDD